MGIFDRAKHAVSAGDLSKRWQNVKKNKQLNLPKENFGIKLDKFENSAKKAQSISKKINELLEDLKKEKVECTNHSEVALNTANFYKGKVRAEETGVIAVLEKIILDINTDTQSVGTLPTTIS